MFTFFPPSRDNPCVYRYFKEASDDDGFEKSESKIRIRIGGFETPFHKLGLRIIVTEDDLDDKSVQTTTGI